MRACGRRPPTAVARATTLQSIAMCKCVIELYNLCKCVKFMLQY